MTRRKDKGSGGHTLGKGKQEQLGRHLDHKRHIRIDVWMYDLPAFQALTPNDKAVYLALKRRYNGYNNGSVSLSVRECQTYHHMTQQAAQRAFNSLVEKGFIKLRKGSFHGNGVRLAREYELTEYGYGDAEPTKDFLWWRAPADGKSSASDSDADCTGIRCRKNDSTVGKRAAALETGTETATSVVVSAYDSHTLYNLPYGKRSDPLFSFRSKLSPNGSRRALENFARRERARRSSKLSWKKLIEGAAS